MQFLTAIIVIVLVQLIGSGRCESIDCPFNGGCECIKGLSYQEFSEIKCDAVPFSGLPAFPSTRIEKLEIKNSGIESLEDDSFGNLLSYSIVLDKNKIYSISNGTFAKMGRTLRELSLNENKFTEVPMNALSPLELHKLQLDGNQISSVVNNWMSLRESLKELKLSNNDIDSIPLDPTRSLSNFRHLYALHLAGNLLQTLEANSLPYSLNLLNASNNYIKNFPNDLLNVLQELQTLDLSRNIIEDLKEHKFRTKIKLDNLNLSNNRLKVIKKPFGDSLKINTLDLSLNNITEIVKESFSGLDCKEINLSYNKLSGLDDSTFKGVESTLERLDLSHNKLFKSPSFLKELKTLKSLNLAYNSLLKLKTSLYLNGLKELSLSGNNLPIFPVEVLGQSLRTLTALDLSYNKIADIRKNDFKNFGKNLEKLRLQSNSLFFLGDNTFEYTPKLTDLSLSFNTIGDMSLNAFKNLEKIERLDLSFSLKGYGFPTPILSMKTLAFLALDNNNINSLSKDITKLDRIQTLILDFNRIKEIESSTFDPKAHKFLKDIRLSYNLISKIDSNSFSELNSLETISLHDNKVMKISEYSFLNLPQNLSIYLSGNRIDNIERKAFSNLPKLKTLDLHNNNLQSFDYQVFHNVSNKNEPMTLNLSRNHIDRLLIPEYSSAPVYISSLDLSYNDIEKIPQKLVEEQTALKFLNLGYNKISVLDSQSLYSMVNLESLILVHNKIQTIQDNSFLSLTKLQMLNLSHNHLEEIPAGLFRSLENLRILDLSFNNIRTVSSSAFDNTKLEQVYLSNNKISSMAMAIFLNLGKTLRILDLSQNQVVNWDSKFFQYSNKIKTLNLCYNNLTNANLSVFRNSSSLLKLELCGNYFGKIPDGVFNANYSPLQELNLAETGLQSFPNLTLPNLITLSLAENKIKNITETFFSGVPKLKKLILKNNEISALNNINWIQVLNLRHLDLSHNPIKILNKPCFNGLYDLRELNIQHLDQISHLDSGIFMDLDKLISLKIDFQRKVGLNLNQTLTHLKYLRDLSLNVMDNNLMDDLPELPWKLRSLEITGENLKYIDPDVLKSLKNFHNFNLRITRTRISDFQKHFFTHFKAKQFHIDLSNNDLKKIGPEVLYFSLGSIRRFGTKAFGGGIHIHGNKLTCGCEIKWFAEWLRRYLVETVEVNQKPAKERLAHVEALSEITCLDDKTQQHFPILSYDFTADEKLCGIVLNVPRVSDTKDSASKNSIFSGFLFMCFITLRIVY